MNIFKKNLGTLIWYRILDCIMGLVSIKVTLDSLIFFFTIQFYRYLFNLFVNNFCSILSMYFWNFTAYYNNCITFRDFSAHRGKWTSCSFSTFSIVTMLNVSKLSITKITRFCLFWLKTLIYGGFCNDWCFTNFLRKSGNTPLCLIILIFARSKQYSILLTCLELKV